MASFRSDMNDDQGFFRQRFNSYCAHHGFSFKKHDRSQVIHHTNQSPPFIFHFGPVKSYHFIRCIRCGQMDSAHLDFPLAGFVNETSIPVHLISGWERQNRKLHVDRSGEAGFNDVFLEFISGRGLPGGTGGNPHYRQK